MLAALLVLAPSAACGFPDVNFEQSTDAGKDRNAGSSSGSSSGSGDDSSSSSGGGVDAETDSRMSVDGSSSGDDSTAPLDAPAQDAPLDVAFEAAPDANPCDKDGDGYLAEGACGGNDCCDTDHSAHPGQTGWFTTADFCGSFNYSCSSSGVTYQYKNSLTCGGIPTTGCTGGSGFVGMVACGAMGPFATCAPTGTLSCGPVAGGNSQQACH
jgi:hypothetical protein